LTTVFQYRSVTSASGRLPAAVIVGALILVCGAVAWASGYPFIFPSLGPSAHLLATRPTSPESAPRRIIGGHAIGTIIELCLHALIAPELGLSALSVPFSVAGLRLGVAAVLSMVLTTATMAATGVLHTPACATTLLVALGVLSTPTAGVIIMVAVCLLVCAQQLVRAVNPTDQDRTPG
jgi:CBS-domain-containing membrane protein